MSTATNVQKHFSLAHGDDLKEVSSTTSNGSMNTDIAHLISAILDASDADTRDLRRNVLLDYIVGSVNAGEKMHQRAGLKLHHGGMPNAPTGRLLRRDKQNEKRIASPAKVPETSSLPHRACSRCLN